MASRKTALRSSLPVPSPYSAAATRCQRRRDHRRRCSLDGDESREALDARRPFTRDAANAWATSCTDGIRQGAVDRTDTVASGSCRTAALAVDARPLRVASAPSQAASTTTFGRRTGQRIRSALWRRRAGESIIFPSLRAFVATICSAAAAGQ